MILWLHLNHNEQTQPLHLKLWMLFPRHRFPVKEPGLLIERSPFLSQDKKNPEYLIVTENPKNEEVVSKRQGLKKIPLAMSGQIEHKNGNDRNKL